HQGIAAIIKEYGYAPLDELIAAAPDPLVIVDGVTDPRNLGAILRSAEGAGVHLKIAQCGNVARMLGELKDAGYWVAALTPGGETPLYELDTSRRLAIVVGSE